VLATTPANELGFELFELLPDAILAVDQQGIIRYANRQAGKLFRQEPATLTLTPIETLLPEDLRELHAAHRNKYNSEPLSRPMGTGLDLVALRADGTTFPADILLNPLKHLAEPIVLAVVRDMTDRRTAERLQLALDAAQLGWWRYDVNGVLSGDARFKEIFDVTLDEMPIEDFKKLLHPDDTERFWADREGWLNSVDRKPHAHEYRVRQREGAVRWVETHL
jgi:PAS domain S-box-containing protein